MERNHLEQIIIDYNKGISINFNSRLNPMVSDIDNLIYRLGQYIFVYLSNKNYVNYSKPIPLFDKKINSKIREFINAYSLAEVIKIWNELFDIIEKYEESHKTTIK